MTGNEFLKRLKALAKLKSVTVKYDPKRGKGSHGTVYFGDKRTILRNPKDELKTGTLHGMCDDLGVKVTEL